MVLTAQVTVNSDSGPLSSGNGFDNRGGPLGGISPCKESRNPGLPADRIGLNKALCIKHRAGSFEKLRRIKTLTDGQNNLVSGNGQGPAVGSLRAPPARTVIPPQSHGKTLYPADISVTVFQELNRLNKAVQDDPLFQGVFNLLLIGGHGIPASSVDNGDRFSSQTEGGPGGIDGGISSPHNGHMLPDPCSTPDVVLLQKGNGLQDSGSILSGKPHIHIP